MFQVQAVEVSSPVSNAMDAWSKVDQQKILIHEMSTSFEDTSDIRSTQLSEQPQSSSQVSFPPQCVSKIPKYVRRGVPLESNTGFSFTVKCPNPDVCNQYPDHF